MANPKGRCDGCCIAEKQCKGCARCIPKYLCVSVALTAAASVGTGSGTGTSNPMACCGFKFTLQYICESKSWSGSGGCSPQTLSLTIWQEKNSEVTGTGSADQCTTYVDSEYAHDVMAFRGSFDGINYSVSDASGNEYQVSVTAGASVVENPLFYDKCSPCRNNRCLPEKLCVTALCSVCDPNAQAIYMWDCPSRSWHGSPVSCNGTTYDINITLTSTESGVCGIIISAANADTGTGSGTGTGDSGTTTVAFENEGDAFISAIVSTKKVSFLVQHIECETCGSVDGDIIFYPACRCKTLPPSIIMNIDVSGSGCIDNLGPLVFYWNPCIQLYVAPPVHITCPTGIFGSGFKGVVYGDFAPVEWDTNDVHPIEEEPDQAHLFLYGKSDSNPSNPETLLDEIVSVQSCSPYEAMLGPITFGPEQLACPMPGTTVNFGSCQASFSFTAYSATENS